MFDACYAESSACKPGCESSCRSRGNSKHASQSHDDANCSSQDCCDEKGRR